MPQLVNTFLDSICRPLTNVIVGLLPPYFGLPFSWDTCLLQLFFFSTFSTIFCGLFLWVFRRKKNPLAISQRAGSLFSSCWKSQVRQRPPCDLLLTLFIQFIWPPLSSTWLWVAVFLSLGIKFIKLEGEEAAENVEETTQPGKIEDVYVSWPFLS